MAKDSPIGIYYTHGSSIYGVQMKPMDSSLLNLPFGRGVNGEVGDP